MHQALNLKKPNGVHVPSERTVYRVMDEIGISHRPKRKPNGITKADKEARKSDDLIRRNFSSNKPLVKCVTDMTEIKCQDGKLYVSAIFDCFDSAVLGLAMDTNMKEHYAKKHWKLHIRHTQRLAVVSCIRTGGHNIPVNSIVMQ